MVEVESDSGREAMKRSSDSVVTGYRMERTHRGAKDEMAITDDESGDTIWPRRKLRELTPEWIEPRLDRHWP